ncbi:unnamed protein product [Linum trigynum]|uniref:Uncharacterized protein n=1 Tax=Linum trigynum TaxID=586398 RepID=A0AAV2CUQ7_9ROSI
MMTEMLRGLEQIWSSERSGERRQQSIASHCNEGDAEAEEESGRGVSESLHPLASLDPPWKWSLETNRGEEYRETEKPI